MGRNSKVNIIIPVYNAEQYLAKCIESILAQTYKDINIILVNDGSTDNCGEICDLYAQKDLRISVIHKENGGVTSARRAGSEYAKGEWLSFVDADDTLPPRAIEGLINASEGVDIVKGSCQLVDDEGNKIPMLVNKIRISGCQFIFNTLHNKINFLPLWGGIYKRELIDSSVFDVSPAKIITGEDRLNVIRICGKTDLIQLIPEIVYEYMQHKESVSHKFVWTYNYIVEYDDYLMEIFKEKNVMEVYHEELLKYRISALVRLIGLPTMKMRSEYIRRIRKDHKNTPKSIGQRITLFLAEMPYWLRNPLFHLYTGIAKYYRSRKIR
ncbi:MAG: glycosyltransferase [Tannerella sp.]|jgi:glycosyltransferase involved in cell wall biosynthesis|nr:glycosyltransferase [Tannerella sp.]